MIVATGAMTTLQPNSEPTYPNPPPYWWTKRLLLFAAVLALGLVIAWNWWAREAQRRVDAEVAAIRARGEPLDAADFEVAPIPDSLNAAVSIVAAIGKVPASEVNFIANLPSRMKSGPLAPADQQGVDRVTKASTTMQSLVRTARFQPGIVWSTNVLKNPPTWGSQTSLPRTLLADALHEHLAGSDAEAIEILRDMIFVTDSLERPRPNLLMHLLATFNGSITFDAVEGITPDLQVMPQIGATTQPTGPASREQVAALIAALLDDQDMQKGLARGLQAERVIIYSAINPASRVRSTVSPWGSSSLAWPWVQLEILRSMQAMDQIIGAAEAADVAAEQTAMSKEVRSPLEESALTRSAHTLSNVGGMKFGARVDQQLSTLASRRVAAIRLAIRLYQVDHDGTFPETLDELVPRYLPALPTDPTDPGGKLFTYRKSPPTVIAAYGAFPLTRTQRSRPATTSAN